MIQVLQRAFGILQFVASSAEPCGLSEIAAHSGIGATTCANIVKELLQNGYLDQEGRGKAYRLGPMALGLSFLAGPYAALRYAAEPVTQRLAEQTGETAVVSVLNGTRKLVVCYTEGSETIRFALQRGIFDDLHWTATGHLLLAHLPPAQRSRIEQALRQRWGQDAEAAPFLRALDAAVERARTADVVVCATPKVLQLAAPLRVEGRVLAGLGCYLPQFRADEERVRTVTAALREGAGEINEALRTGLGLRP